MSDKKKTISRKASNRNGIRRFVFVCLSFILEILLVTGMVMWFDYRAEFFAVLLRVVVLFLVLGIYSQYKTSAMKTPWIVLIMGFPAMGVAVFLLSGLSGVSRKMRREIQKIDAYIFDKLPGNLPVLQELDACDRSAANISLYLKRTAGFPVYRDTAVSYYDVAEKALESMIEEIQKAKAFVFMEYHAFEDTEAFHRVEDALVERVAAGVEVRILYDDVGSLPFITMDFIDRMRERGIKARMFNPVNRLANFFMNNRDHRKLTVIDSVVGFTGGYNIADEYFNITHPYGHWKDSGVKLTGGAVKNLTALFLEMWNAARNNDSYDTEEEIANYIFANREAAISARHLQNPVLFMQDKCFVQPYGDTPMDNEPVGENVYISLIERAKDYFWISTPYLIITDEMIHAMGLAAKRGVDVRVITPGIPDKRVIYSVTRSYYHSLARNGVRIFEYTPGFNHSKICVSDGTMATCGTINLDYRSLYHHFEDGCLFYGGHIVKDIHRDLEYILSESNEVTQYYASGRGKILRFGQLILRLFAPLL